MHRSAAVMAAGKITSNRHRHGPRHRRHRSCPRYGHGWKRARSYASRATISSDIRRKSAMLRVLQPQDRRPIATLSGSRRASRFWLTTVPHAPKSSRRTSPKRPGGPIATCRRPRHPLSPKAQAQGNDGPALGASGRSPTKKLSIVKQRVRVHGRRLSWLLGWHRSVDRSVLGCVLRASGGVAERRRAGV
jgi:hypothetical protein